MQLGIGLLTLTLTLSIETGQGAVVTGISGGRVQVFRLHIDKIPNEHTKGSLLKIFEKRRTELQAEDRNFLKLGHWAVK